MSQFVGRGRTRRHDGGGRLGASILLDAMPLKLRIITVRNTATLALTGVQIEVLLDQVRVRPAWLKCGR